ncbi:MAG: hypothetical protein ABW185_03500 [Sedimenticola sp.]
MSLTTLNPVVLANDEYVEPQLNSPYNGGATDEFNSSQTFVKQVYMEQVSYNSRNPDLGEYDSQGSFRCESGQPAVTSQPDNSMDLDESLIYLGSEHEQSPTEGVIQRLTNIFRCLPRDMFVNRIIKCYGSSDRLETIRVDLFDYLKGYEEFPYGSQVELKRRIQTRGGDTLVAKLARDIHCLVAVVEGADFNTLTDLMSLSRPMKARASQSVAQTPNSRVSHNCSCEAELKLLKDSVAQMKADIINLKQTNSIYETRLEQLKPLKSSLDHLTIDMHDMQKVVHSDLNEVKRQLTVLTHVQTEARHCVPEPPTSVSPCPSSNGSDPGTNVDHLTNIGIPGTDAVAAGTCTPSARAESPERHVDVGIAITDQGPPRNGNNGVGTGVTPPIESTKTAPMIPLQGHSNYPGQRGPSVNGNGETEVVLAPNASLSMDSLGLFHPAVCTSG